MAGHCKPYSGASIRERLDYHSMPEPNSGCVLWLGTLNNMGYGNIRIDKKHYLAHRVSYQDARGPIPDGLVLDHLCRTPCCINPWHLEAVTFRENVLRGRATSAENARKKLCKRGHEFTGVNTFGARYCNLCTSILRKEQRRRRGPMKKGPPPKTHCIRGHEMSGDNLRIYGGERKCRTCTNMRQKARNRVLRGKA